MKPRWIVLIVAASLVAGAIAYLIFRVAAVSASFTPPEVNVEGAAAPWGQGFAPRLLERLGYSVRIHRFPYDRSAYDLIVRRYQDEDEIEQWRTWLAAGKRLVLLCLKTDGEGRVFSPGSAHPLLRSVKTLSLDPSAALGEFPAVAEDGLRETVLARRGEPAIVLEKAEGGGEIVYVADANAFSDRNLVRGDNVFLLNNCLAGHFGEPIAFDYSSFSTSRRRGADGDWFDTGGDGDEVFFLFRGNFLFLFLELLFLGLVFILVFWKRFGPVRDTEQFARRSLLRHLEATGNFFEKTSNPLVVVDILDRYFLARLRELVRLVSGSRADIEADVRRRLPAEDGDAGAAGADVFALNEKKNLAARDHHRERIILKLKGVDKHHGKNKNPG